MTFNKTLVLSVAAATLLTTGCSQQTAQTAQTAKAATSTKTASTVASTKVAAATTTSAVAPLMTSDGSFTLPNAKSGTCYGKVVIPAQYKTVTEKIKATPESTKLEIIPAQYKTVTEKVLDMPATTKIVAIPATYKTESRTVTVSPASTSWKTGLHPEARVASSALIAAARAAGMNLEAAKSGSCFYEFYAAPQYKTVSEKVLATAASQRILTQPAVLKSGTKRILVTPASTKLVKVPATYKTVTDRIQVAPAKKVWKNTQCHDRDCSVEEMMCLVDVPAVYKTVTKQVLVTPETTKTVTIPAVYKTVSTNEVAVQASSKTVDVPATYKTITKQVKASDAKYVWSDSMMEKPGMSRTSAVICKVSTPAVSKTITKQVVATPATTKTVTIPATYKTVQVTKVVKPESTKTLTIPATYKTITKQVKVSDQAVKWMPVLCKSSMTIETISKIQKALTNAGFNTPVTGSLDSATKAAVRAYQTKNGLTVSGLSIDTLKRLGVL